MARSLGCAGVDDSARRQVRLRAARRARRAEVHAPFVDGLEPGRVGARRAARRAAAARRSTRWSSPTSSCRKPREHADIVLPAAQWAEEDGTMTNLEGRVILRRRAIAPARRRAHRPRDSVGHRGRARDAAAGFRIAEQPRRLRRAAARHRGRRRPTTRASPTRASTPRTACSGRARAADHPGTPRLFAERFPTPSGRARFHADAARRDRRRARRRVSAAPHDRAACSRSTSRARRRGASPELQAVVAGAGRGDPSGDGRAHAGVADGDASR